MMTRVAASYATQFIAQGKTSDARQVLADFATENYNRQGKLVKGSTDEDLSTLYWNMKTFELGGTSEQAQRWQTREAPLAREAAARDLDLTM